MPESVRRVVVGACTATHFAECAVVFSGLDSSVAGDVEGALAAAGIFVCSNAKNYRMADDVPILLPLVNPNHVAIVAEQRRRRQWTRGAIVTNANCSATGLATALQPLHEKYGVETVHVVTMQAISGAGYPGVASLDILGNVIPFIDEEEQKLESETRKILGAYADGRISAAPIGVAAACNRVPVLNGHTECVTVTLRDKTASCDDVRAAWLNWRVAEQSSLPSAPAQIIEVLDGPRPQVCFCFVLCG